MGNSELTIISDAFHFARIWSLIFAESIPNAGSNMEFAVGEMDISCRDCDEAIALATTEEQRAANNSLLPRKF